MKMKKSVFVVGIIGMVLVMGLVLTGCMSIGKTWETREPGPDEIMVVIQRPYSWLHSQFFMDVVLDKDTANRRAMLMDNGKKISLIVPNGEHTLTVVIHKWYDIKPTEKGNTTTFTASSSPITYSLKIKGSAFTGVQYIWTQNKRPLLSYGGIIVQ
jgi:hypothetical protein